MDGRELERDFRRLLEEKLEAAGHRLGVTKYSGSLTINHADVRVEVSMSKSSRSVSWRRTDPARIAFVTIGGGEYRGRLGQRFNARKAGWDWDAIVKECVEESARKLARSKQERELRKKKEALEDDPATKQAVELSHVIAATVQVDHNGIELTLRGLTPATALAVVKLVKERS